MLTTLSPKNATSSTWDALVQAAEVPYAAPAWALAWWDHLRPPGASPWIVSTAGGVAPCYISGGRLPRVRLMASGVGAPVGPVCPPGEEAAFARGFAARIAHRGVPVELSGISGRDAWHHLLAEALGWDMVRIRRRGAPIVYLDQTSEAWWLGRSRNFRQQMRGSRRKLLQAGARLEREEPPFDEAIDDLVRMHLQRWEERGGSAAVAPPVVAMLRDAGSALPPDRFQLWSVTVDGRRIAAHLFLAAGGTVNYWLGGFDPAWGSLRPSMVLLMEAIDAAREEGRTRFDLGPGVQAYKRRITHDLEGLEWVLLAPRDARGLATRAAVLPTQIGVRAASRWPEAARWTRRQLALAPDRFR